MLTLFNMSKDILELPIFVLQSEMLYISTSCIRFTFAILLLSHLWWSYPEPEFLAENPNPDPASEMRPEDLI